jgi:hypothetical protein
MAACNLVLSYVPTSSAVKIKRTFTTETLRAQRIFHVLYLRVLRICVVIISPLLLFEECHL